MDTALFKARLAACGLSQTKLAQRLDINPITIIRAMRGDFEPRLDVARRMARELGTTVDALFPGDAPTLADPPKPRRFRAIPGGAKGTPSHPQQRASVAEAGRIGGRARAERMTPEQRSEAARKAVLARWSRAAEANAMCACHRLPATYAVRSAANTGHAYPVAA